MTWSWAVFFAKITSRKFWVWLSTTLLTYTVVKKAGEQNWITPVIVVWGIVSFVYLCGEAVIDALGKAIERANIGIQIGGGYDGTKQKNAGGTGSGGPGKV